MSAGGDGKIKLFDTFKGAVPSEGSGRSSNKADEAELTELTATVKGLQQVEPISESRWGKGHAFSVCWVEWYPFDTGLFVSGGKDSKVIFSFNHFL